MDYEFTPPAKRICRFMGFGNDHVRMQYPRWLYHDDLEPRLAENTDEEKGLRDNGYDAFNAGMLANKTVVNWYWDLEDFSPRQLAVFAKDEYGVDLPHEASQEVLYKAVCELSRTSPQNENRLVLIAQVLDMNLDETMNEIRRMTSGGIGVETETETHEVMM